MAWRSTNTSKARDRRIALAWAVTMVLFVLPVAGDDGATTERYVLDYPVAQQFCPPVDSYADDVTQPIQKVGGRTIRHQLNGGYGLPVVIMVGNQHVLHLGADVAWYRVGTPVYAIADGVVRVSQGALPAMAAKGVAKTVTAHASAGAKSIEIKGDAVGAGDVPTTGADGDEQRQARMRPKIVCPAQRKEPRRKTQAHGRRPRLAGATSLPSSIICRTDHM